MSTTRHRLQKGETLTGLLVGLALGMVVLAAGSTMLTSQLRGHRQALHDTHLHHDLRSAMDWMAKELRQAQYSAKAWETRSPTLCLDDFCQDAQDFSLSDETLAFSYDRNHNGQREKDECMGFRLSSQTIQIKRSCQDAGDWQAITDTSSLKVSALQWTLHCSAAQGWLRRSVQMTLSAAWPQDPGRTMSLTQTVRLQNDLPASVQSKFCP